MSDRGVMILEALRLGLVGGGGADDWGRGGGVDKERREEESSSPPPPLSSLTPETLSAFALPTATSTGRRKKPHLTIPGTAGDLRSILRYLSCH